MTLISINTSTRELFNRDKNIFDNILSFKVALDITKSDYENKWKIAEEYQRRNNWPKLEISNSCKIDVINKA